MALEIATMLDNYWLEGKDTAVFLNVGLAGANSGLLNLISEVLEPCLNHIINCPLASAFLSIQCCKSLYCLVLKL